VAGPDGLLIFPETRPLAHLDLFDRQPTVETSLARAGQGGEFLGVREYRPGDPPRHVHWRTTAHAGRLIVKEFAEEQQPALTLALDLSPATAPGGPDVDDSPLELGTKLAASLARHAAERGLPVRLLTNSRAWPAPAGPLSPWALLSYLARVQAGESDPFAAALTGVSFSTFVAAVLPAPDPAVVAPLVNLQRRGLSVLAVIVDPLPFAGDRAAAQAARRLAAELAAAGVAVRLIGGAPDWERQLVAGEAALPATAEVPA
jgi:uncharacterized protein (DUF58 family)